MGLGEEGNGIRYILPAPGRIGSGYCHLCLTVCIVISLFVVYGETKRNERLVFRLSLSLSFGCPFLLFSSLLTSFICLLMSYHMFAVGTS